MANPSDMDHLRNAALEMAAAAGEAILPHFRSALSVENKAETGFDPVTEADRAAEAAIRRIIERRFPEDGIIGEEYGSEREDAERLWVLDPIDATRAFVIGLPIWATLIGVMERGQPVFGLMHQPFIGETFLGTGSHAVMRRNGTETVLSARACATLAEATLATTTPAMFSGDERTAYDRVEAAAKTVRYGTDCYAYALLAAGLNDLVIESGLQSYDVAALIPIVRGAGGQIASWDGEAPDAGGRIVAAGDARVFEAAQAMLQNGI